MKKMIAGGVAGLAALAVSAQVAIQTLDRTGRLTWTNSVVDPVAPPIYRVDQADTPMGPWTGLVTITNQTFLTVTNPHSGTSGSAYYRVAWTNGEIWRYREYDSRGLIVTGELYVSTQYIEGIGLASVSGTWSRTNVEPSVNPWFRVSHGRLSSGPGRVDPFSFAVNFGCYGEPCFWLEGPGPLTSPWHGTWYYEGGIVYFRTNGSFIIERIGNGP